MQKDEETPQDIPKETPKEKAQKLGWLVPKKENGISLPKSPRLVNILITGIVSLLMALLVVFLVAPSEGEFQDLRTELEVQVSTQITDLKTQFGTLSSGIDTKFSSYQASVNSRIASLDSTLSRRIGDVDSRVSTLAGLEQAVNSALAKINSRVDTAVDTKLAALEARIVELEGEEEIAAQEEDLSIEVGSSFFGPYIILENLSPDSPTSGSTQLKLTNNSKHKIENIQLSIIIQSAATLPSLDSSVTKLESIKLGWQGYPYAPGTFVFVSATGWGPFGTAMSLDPGKSMTIYPTFTLQLAAGETPIDSPVQFYVEVQCEGYDTE